MTPSPNTCIAALFKALTPRPKCKPPRAHHLEKKNHERKLVSPKVPSRLNAGRGGVVVVAVAVG